ncbi:pyridoxamine 5'-phosphate oxidase family protein [Streptomyces sp. NPDC097595]|uniref:pyridoxamine 5'-phosphate oxidase family protein n=1 Tax=Streptomyces sp. NPDC097595 TaxID=3366090 RepID=UPI0038089720
MMNEPVAELHPDYSSAGATATPWAEVVAVLERAEVFWLSTVRPDGRPHVTPLPAVWLDGALHFSTGLEEQKGRNLTRNPNCVLTTGNNAYGRGLDVVVEGPALRVAERGTLERLAELWMAKIGWPYDAVEGGFRHRPEGPQPETSGVPGAIVPVFAVRPTKVLAFGRGEAFSQTRFRP